MPYIKHKRNGFFSDISELVIMLAFIIFSFFTFFYIYSKVKAAHTIREYTLKTFEDSYLGENIPEKPENIIYTKETLSNNLKVINYSSLTNKQCAKIIFNIPMEKIPQIREIQFNKILSEGKKDVIFIDSNEERKIATISNSYTPDSLEDKIENCFNSDTVTLSFILEDKK